MKKHSKGMTLVEVILAMGIISIVSVGVLSMFTMSAWIMSNTEEKLQATYTGQEMMEIMYHYAGNFEFSEIGTKLSESNGFKGYDENENSNSVKMTREKKGEFPMQIHYSKKEENEKLLYVEIIVYSDAGQNTIKSYYQAFFPLKEGESND